MTDRANPMTVAEYIAALSQFPPDAPVIVDGYEGGKDYAYPPRLLRVGPKYEGWYYGRFGITATEGLFDAVLVPRKTEDEDD